MQGRHLHPDDGGALPALYETYRHRLDCPPQDAFVQHMASYELAYMMNGANIIGVACRRQGSVHIGVKPEWRGRWATRDFIRTILEWAAQTGKVWTRIAPGNVIGERLVKGVGFVQSAGGRYDLQTQP